MKMWDKLLTQVEFQTYEVFSSIMTTSLIVTTPLVLTTAQTVTSMMIQDSYVNKTRKQSLGPGAVRD